MITRIRELLELRQLSPTQFADLIGVGRPVISHILSERNKPSLEVVQKIISAFPDIELPWLLGGTGPMLTSVAPIAPPASVGPIVAPPAESTIPLPVVEALAAPPVVAIPAPTVLPIPQYAALPNSGANIASASRPLPPKFRPTKPAATPATVGASPAPAAPAIPADAASLTGPSMPDMVPASSPPSSLASVEAMPVVAAPSVIVPAGALPVATPLVSSVIPQVASVANSYDLSSLAQQQTIVAPQPVLPPVAGPSYVPMASTVPGLLPVATQADSAPEVATPNPAAALSFLGEPGKAIRRIVIFYRDGSFSDYVPEGQ